jgi:glycosyltransferase involved in cell wall biosynthesis
MPDISILTTSYNKEQFISECIESVLKSSHQNWEMIILDDCSTDSTYLILERYALQDQRIRIFKNDKNLGDYANRNEIVKYSNSEYIKYLDADDMIILGQLNTF